MGLNVIPTVESIRPWKKILRNNFTKLDALANFLQLSVKQREVLSGQAPFSLNVPVRLAEKMEKGNLHDPLLRQFIPFEEELIHHTGFQADAVNEKLFRKEPKLLHKYQGRALILCTSACAMHCRYCFRKHFPYEVDQKGFELELQTIRQDQSIHEVILSGGDPLSLSDEVLNELMQNLAAIQHVKRLRFHTRFPIGIPERIDECFLKIIENYPNQIYFVLHINHPNELDQFLFDHLKKLQRLGCILLNQSVLLKGVNDDPAIIKTLCEKLIDQGILPYYIHQLDRVEGAVHFEVSENFGREIIQEIAKSLPGYGVPKYVRETPGEPNKTSL
jgi:EF-P beta-lysylation protein EpmB